MNASAHVVAMVEQVRQADLPAEQQAEALVETAFELLKRPKAPQQLWDAVFLYGAAGELAKDHPLARARSLAGRGAALRRMPGEGTSNLQAAKAAFTDALEVLRAEGEAEEVAEAELSLGLCLQALAQVNEASLPEAVQCYQRALRFFSRGEHPREFAILHNNLATAYLSLKLSPERDALREALAVQSFREALSVVTLEDDPAEYAMLQNNLGNALQAMPSSHRFENLSRAIEAYDEALKVRSAREMPVEHANTLANKANALMNLPDAEDGGSAGNPRNLAAAAALLETASRLFGEHGLSDRAAICSGLLEELARDLRAGERN
jgi:tetratricopeptide (TPR) repeat protein